MSLYRAKEYPIKQESESIEGYVKRFRNAVQEESSDRIQDFDILQLGNVPWVDVREYGTKGDGSTDDTTAIQAAIDAGYDNSKTVIIPNSIAKSAYESGYEAIIFPSATELGKAMVLYKDNFRKDSLIKILSDEKLF